MKNTIPGLDKLAKAKMTLTDLNKLEMVGLYRNVVARWTDKDKLQVVAVVLNNNLFYWAAINADEGLAFAKSLVTSFEAALKANEAK